MTDGGGVVSRLGKVLSFLMPVAAGVVVFIEYGPQLTEAVQSMPLWAHVLVQILALVFVAVIIIAGMYGGFPGKVES